MVYVSTHSRAEAAALALIITIYKDGGFQHTAARRRLPVTVFHHQNWRRRFNTQPRGGGCLHITVAVRPGELVSTHSRAEAAATHIGQAPSPSGGFNTQPRGGGCKWLIKPTCTCACFNTQPRGGGCIHTAQRVFAISCFNTQPRGGGCSLPKKVRKISVLNIVFR